MTEQDDNLKRVLTKVRPCILEFQKIHRELRRDKFTMSDLVIFILQHHQIAPDSASRCLRKMRESGEINYDVPAKKDGLYVWLPLGAPTKAKKPKPKLEQLSLFGDEKKT